MKVMITGGCGFLGLQLAKRICAVGQLTTFGGTLQVVEEIILFDPFVPDHLPGGLDDRVRMVKGDIGDSNRIKSLIKGDDISVFHLASVVSFEAEQNFDLASKVNIQGLLTLLDICRMRKNPVKFIFSSSLAVYGEDLPDLTGDDARRNPVTTYGMTKVFGELLVNDMTRRGFIDGRTARLPTVIIRPGRPNKAASSFISGLFREPLNKEPVCIPVNENLRLAVIGARTCIGGLMALHELDGGAFEMTDRTVTLPSRSWSVGEMVAVLNQVADQKNITLGPVRYDHNPEIERIVASWPGRLSSERGLKLGLPQDSDLEGIIAEYIEDFMP